jgi:hypothetical protein
MHKQSKHQHNKTLSNKIECTRKNNQTHELQIRLKGQIHNMAKHG